MAIKKAGIINLGRSTLRVFVMVWGIVLCVTQSYGNSFFGTGWIEKKHDLLNVRTEKTDTAELLGEWCAVCEEQCIIDHDLKHKSSISILGATCEEVLNTVLECNGINMRTHGQVKVFTKGAKGEWRPVYLKRRKASEIAKIVGRLLSPSAKVEQVLSDDVANVIWLPKAFSDNHLNDVMALDILKQSYVLHLSWLEEVQPFSQLFHIDSQLNKEVINWITGRPVQIAMPKLLGWIDGMVNKGAVSILSQASLLLVDGEQNELRLLGSEEVFRRDKKGQRILQDTESCIKLLTKAVGMSGNRVDLDINLEDMFPYEGENGSTSSVILKTSVSLSSGQSLLIGGLSRESKVKKAVCPFVFAHIPIINKVFCNKDQRKERKRFILVVSLAAI